MKTYTGYLLTDYVPENDWPEAGEIYVALDLQNRLGPQTWLVAVMGDGTCQGDTVQLGLFWEVGIAVYFALMLNRNPDVLKRHLEGVEEYYKQLAKHNKSHTRSP